MSGTFNTSIIAWRLQLKICCFGGLVFLPVFRGFLMHDYTWKVANFEVFNKLKWIFYGSVFFVFFTIFSNNVNIG